MEISGKIVIDGKESEFQLFPSGYPGLYMQGGADVPVLGERVELLAGMAQAVQDWADEHLCTECSDAVIDDGEGFDGLCGNCADRKELAGGDDD